MILARRTFLVLASAASFVPPRSSALQEVPSVLDHLLLGCSDLQRGVDYVEQHTGVRAAFGGVHPGRGTQNALLSLAAPSAQMKGRYLEIIAPDPQQSSDNPLAQKLRSLAEPRLVGWAAHPDDINSLAAKLQQARLPADGPTPGSRKRPGGKIVHWQTLNLKDDADGLLPFFIQWGADSMHPSSDAPIGCRLLAFQLLSPDPDALTKITGQLGLDVEVLKNKVPQLHAVISGPKGQLDLTS
jgi:hypothetical protein